MSIVRIGLGETKKFAEGYEAIFGKKTGSAEPEATQSAEPATPKKKKEKKAKKKKK